LLSLIDGLTHKSADGDHPIQSMETHTSVQNRAKGSSVVKDVQILLKSWLDHPGIGPVLSGWWSLIQERQFPELMLALNLRI